jgi:hypothetical protein
MPPINNEDTKIKQQITLNTNYFGTDGVVITENTNTTPKRIKFDLNVMIFVLIFLVLASVSYAYFNKIGFFSRPPYDENNLMFGLVSKFPDIKSASYKVSVDLYTKDRDTDAIPFNIKSDVDVENNLKYSRDYKRSQDLVNILNKLKYYQYSGLNYPKKLSAILEIENYGFDDITIIDPLSKNNYKYSLTADSKDFVLEVDFETSSAISEILKLNRYADENAKIVITEKTAKFSKDTYSYFYLSSRPPKSFFESMNEFSSMIPVDININGAISGASSWGDNKGPVDWKFNIAGQGDFGDLTYKVNVDINRKDKNYFAKINNLPSFLFFSQIPKGEWIKLNSESDENNSGSYLPDVNKIEEKIADSKDELINFVKKFATIADEEDLYTFKEKPQSEKINGKLLYKYDLKVKKNSIVSFYKKIVEELYKDEYDSIDEITLRAEASDVLAYLESNEFNEIFDYYDKNSKTVIWVDSNGNPAIFKFTFRIVPPDENLALKDKQIMLTYKIELGDINVPVTVEQPENFIFLEEIMGSMFSGSQEKMDNAVVKSNLMSMRTQAELVFDEYSGYGTKPFSLGECKNTAGTLFENSQVQGVFDIIKEKKSKLMCVSNSVSGKVTSFAVSATLPDDSGYSFCVDSKGFSGEIFGELSGISCSDLE